MISDLKKMPITKIKGITKQLVLEMRKLSVYTVYDLLTFFPEARNFKRVQVADTNNMRVRYTNYHDIQVDVMRDSRVFKRTMQNGTHLVNFHCVPVGVTPDNDPRNKHQGEGFFVNCYAVRGAAELAQDHQYFTVNGLWASKWANITISRTSSLNVGWIQPHKPLIIHTIGKYTTKFGVPQGHIVQLIVAAYQQYGNLLTDEIPLYYRKRYDIMPRHEAVYNCHFPDSDVRLDKARRSEQYAELYEYAYQLQTLHMKRTMKPGFQVSINMNLINQFTRSLPYTLTHDQQACVKDILTDMKSPAQMARLLQGDVGSGKTVVAAYGILAAISAGYQAAIMVPTGPLAAQHFQTFGQMFKHLPITIALLTGKTTAANKRKLSKLLQAGKVDLVIGTEAIYQKGIHYRKLGLVVIDEQHRFGVRQRKTLAQKTKGCNVLSMTATPIPRTLASAVYQAMDVSQIRQMPKGRKPIKTYWATPDKFGTIQQLQEIAQMVASGGQTFLIAKLVTPSKSKRMAGCSDALDVYATMAPLLKQMGISCGLIHGRMKAQDKDKVLHDFSVGKFDVLIATSVVEVGVDIPKANNMIVLNADLYGLAQLHQLRGRVGRNSSQAYCILIAKPKSKTSLFRMKAMEATDDGFKIAQYDLKLRGGGNIFGRAQSGLPDFPMAKLNNDKDEQILQQMQQPAARVVRAKMQR